MGFLGMEGIGWGGIGQGINDMTDKILRQRDIERQREANKALMLYRQAQAKRLEELTKAAQEKADAENLKRAGLAEAATQANRPPMAENPALATLAADPRYQDALQNQGTSQAPWGQMPRGQITPVGNEQLTGLMQGGFDPTIYFQKASPYLSGQEVISAFNAAQAAQTAPYQRAKLAAETQKALQGNKPSLITGVDAQGEPIRTEDKPNVKPYEQKTDFKLFYNTWKTAGKTDAQISALWHKQKEKEAINIGLGRAQAYGDIRLVTVLDTKDPNPDTRLRTMNVNDFNDLNAKYPNRFVQSSQSPEQKEAMAAARQRAGMRSANVQTAYKVFSQEAGELVALRKKVQDKGLLPEGLKDVGTINQWIGKKTNDPDVAELQKKTKLLADTLQRTIGGTQGGQWAFEVAADILDPTYNAQAFKRIIISHTKTFQRMADAYKEFGKEENIPPPAVIGPPQRAIDYLKKNPKQAIFFDQKYGKGASKRYLGGR